MEADMATMEKKGIATGLKVAHPLTGETIDVWVGNYVLMSYGDGAVMGVPAHDERDLSFANKYGIAVKQVIACEGQIFDAAAWQDWYGDKQRGVCINSGKYDGLAYGAAVEAVATDLVAMGLGEKKVQWRLRDWGISRQRYWGTPIPLIHCDDCGVVPVPYEDLPVKLPEHLVPDGSGNPLNKHAAFLNCACPKCKKPARRETDTMDTFVDSSWYFMRYASSGSSQAMVDARADYWMPMDQYIGGIEHAILHLLYARFWTKVMRDTKLVSYDEPFTKLLCQGMVLNHIYQRKGGVDGKGGIEYFWPSDVTNEFGADGRINGATLNSDSSKVEYAGVGTMSKSKNNGVDPQQLIDQYGADTARLFVMFASHPEQTLEWSDTGVEGSYRFIKRLWALGVKLAGTLASDMPQSGDFATASEAVKNLRREIHLNLKQSDFDYTRIQYNTVVSAAMKMLNAIEDAKLEQSKESTLALRECLSILLRCLYPVTPHITCELWANLGFKGSLLDAPWPKADEAALKQDVIELVVQVNGKVRGSIKIDAQADQAAIEAATLASDVFTKYSDGKPARKVIVVKGRLVNVVV